MTAEELEQYNTTMREKIEKATAEDHIIHGFMLYRCEKCGNGFFLWLEKGLEDPVDDQKTGKHKPVPFSITCPTCGGHCYHAWWNIGRDSRSSEYKSYKEHTSGGYGTNYKNFFWNDPDSECGVPIIFKPDFVFDFLGQMNLVSVTVQGLESERSVIVDEFIQAINNIFGTESEIPSKPTLLMPDEGLNREQRRHGIFGKSGYSRPRKNKKLYEY